MRKLSARNPVMMFAILVCTLSPRVASSNETAPSPADIQRWGMETLAMIERDFRIPGAGRYAEGVGRRYEPARPAYMWSAGVQLTALVAAARLEPQIYIPSIQQYAADLKSYWNRWRGIEGYDVQPHADSVDRYYDDNAWIVLALTDAYELQHDEHFLTDAKATLQFVLSGEDEQLGGGLYWRELEKESKNTCTNAPAIVGALRLFQLTGEQSYLDTAKRLYNWTQKNLQDPSDGLYWDNIALDGKLDRRKFSYNSALMIRANCLLFKVTDEKQYLAEAQRIAHAAEDKWVDPSSGAIRDPGKFAHMLLEAFLALRAVDNDDHWLEVCVRSGQHVRAKLRDERGYYAGYWGEPSPRRRRSVQLIDQASVARAFLVVADAMNSASSQ